jgi:DNA-binding transcriptional ArsR family regulator
MAINALEAPVPRAGLEPAVALFGTLADATRLAIVRSLAAGGPARVVDLTGRLAWPS